MSESEKKKGKPRGAPRPRLTDKYANVHHDKAVPPLVSLTQAVEFWGVKTKTAAKKMIMRANEGHPEDALPVPYVRVSGIWLLRREVMVAAKTLFEEADRGWMETWHD